MGCQKYRFDCLNPRSGLPPDKSDSARQLSSDIQSKLLCGNYYLWWIFGNYDLSDIDIVGRNMCRLHMQAKQIPEAYRHGRFRHHMPDALLYGSGKDAIDRRIIPAEYMRILSQKKVFRTEFNGYF